MCICMRFCSRGSLGSVFAVVFIYVRGEMGNVLVF